MTIQDFQSGFSILKDIVVALAAWIGVAAWRKQLAGKTDFELGRRLLRSALDVRTAIAEARNPWIDREFEAARKLIPQEDQLLDPSKGEITVYNIRFNKVVDAWFRLENEIIDAEVSWGSNAKAVKAQLELCVKELGVAIHSHKRKFGAGYKRTTDDTKTDAIIYSTRDDSDAFAKQVDAAIKRIEDLVAPHIRSRSVFSFFGRRAVQAVPLKKGAGGAST